MKNEVTTRDGVKGWWVLFSGPNLLDIDLRQR